MYGRGFDAVAVVCCGLLGVGRGSFGVRHYSMYFGVALW